MIRSASHAGSWYSQEANELSSQLENWLSAADSKMPSVGLKARAIIGPHAGYRFSGPTAAFAYKAIDFTGM